LNQCQIIGFIGLCFGHTLGRSGKEMESNTNTDFQFQRASD